LPDIGSGRRTGQIEDAMSLLSAMEPLLPDDPALLVRARAVLAAAARLGRHLHPDTLAAIAELLRTVNCYYSNLIEGHDTHPIDIERAMRDEYARGAAERSLQEEARAHIEVQVLMEEVLAADPVRNVCARDFLTWLHREFYLRVPESLRVVRNPESDQQEPVVPGALRHYDVSVGRHIAPPHAEISACLDRLAEAYDPARHDGAEALVALAAAHHRVLWVHPFGDGNGRVTRLMTDAYLRRIGIGGHGLWTASRGLARRKNEYQAALAEADRERWDDYDGRGARSRRGLIAFCEFFLATCSDQIEYMQGLLKVDELAARVEAYGRRRESGELPGSRRAEGHRAAGRASRFRPEATRLLRDLVYRGTLPRSEVPVLTGLEERTARRLLRRLLDEGFLRADSSRAPLRLRIPAHAAPYFFPDLYSPKRGIGPDETDLHR
jgi:Fic family protein